MNYGSGIAATPAGDVELIDAKGLSKVGDYRVMVERPHAVTTVEQFDRRDAVRGVPIYCLRVRYDDGARAIASYLAREDRDGLAVIMARMMEAAKV